MVNPSVYNMLKSCYLDYRRNISVTVLKLWFIPQPDFETASSVDPIQHENFSTHSVVYRVYYASITIED
jgi:hypothetical protein